jgi:hypothetical protein
MGRKHFDIIEIKVNGKLANRVIIDSHATERHPDITDETVLDLVLMLNEVEQIPDDIKAPYEYYVSLLLLNSKQYRLVWLLEEGELYVGVITAYRDDRRY